MDTGTRWAAGIAKLSGALAWGVGLLIHVQCVPALTWALEEVLLGRIPGQYPLTWQTLLFSILYLVSGPLAVTVGGGLRFLGGILSSQKVGGERIGRIALYEWLRYELVAVGIALILGSLFSFPDFSPTNSNWDIGLTICLFSIYVTLGFFSLSRGFRFRRMSENLMWEARAEGLQRGMVPYPADAIHSTKRFEGGTWKDHPGPEPRG